MDVDRDADAIHNFEGSALHGSNLDVYSDLHVDANVLGSISAF